MKKNLTTFVKASTVNQIGKALSGIVFMKPVVKQYQLKHLLILTKQIVQLLRSSEFFRWVGDCNTGNQILRITTKVTVTEFRKQNHLNACKSLKYKCLDSFFFEEKVNISI